MAQIIKGLFVDWKLEIWAQVLEIIGASVGIISFIITLILRRDIKKLRVSYIFEKRITFHIKKLVASTNELNNLLNDYNNSTISIKVELARCQTELEDILSKLNTTQSNKVKRLIRLIKGKRNKGFLLSTANEKNIFKNFFRKFSATNVDHIWKIYTDLHAVIRQLENIQQDKKSNIL